jgi:hypothetical protein
MKFWQIFLARAHIIPTHTPSLPLILRDPWQNIRHCFLTKRGYKENAGPQICHQPLVRPSERGFPSTCGHGYGGNMAKPFGWSHYPYLGIWWTLLPWKEQCPPSNNGNSQTTMVVISNKLKQHVLMLNPLMNNLTHLCDKSVKRIFCSPIFYLFMYYMFGSSLWFKVFSCSWWCQWQLWCLVWFSFLKLLWEEIRISLSMSPIYLNCMHLHTYERN